jgi:hypothetical protein
MANIILNRLVIIGEDVKTIMDQLAGPESELEFQNIISEKTNNDPDLSPADWRLVNWGSRSDADCVEVELINDNHLEYIFVTSWWVPSMIPYQLAEKYPKHKIMLAYYEPGNGIAGYVIAGDCKPTNNDYSCTKRWADNFMVLDGYIPEQMYESATEEERIENKQAKEEALIKMKTVMESMRQFEKNLISDQRKEE